jgi:hypothetical protein
MVQQSEAQFISIYFHLFIAFFPYLPFNQMCSVPIFIKLRQYYFEPMLGVLML